MQLHELKPKDISGPGRDPDEPKITNSHYQPSWIWLAQHVNPLKCSELEISEDEFNNSMGGVGKGKGLNDEVERRAAARSRGDAMCHHLPQVEG